MHRKCWGTCRSPKSYNFSLDCPPCFVLFKTADKISLFMVYLKKCIDQRRTFCPNAAKNNRISVFWVKNQRFNLWPQRHKKEKKNLLTPENENRAAPNGHPLLPLLFLENKRCLQWSRDLYGNLAALWNPSSCTFYKEITNYVSNTGVVNNSESNSVTWPRFVDLVRWRHKSFAQDREC